MCHWYTCTFLRTYTIDSWYIQQFSVVQKPFIDFPLIWFGRDSQKVVLCAYFKKALEKAPVIANHQGTYNVMRPGALIFQSSSQNGQLSRNRFALRLLSRFISWHIFLVHLQSQRNQSKVVLCEWRKEEKETFVVCSNFSAASSWSFFYCSWDPAAGIELLLSTVFIIVATNHCFYYRQILHCVQLFRLLASIVCACDRYIFCAARSSRLLKSTVPWKSSSRVIKNLLLNEWQVCIELVGLSSNINA